MDESVIISAKKYAEQNHRSLSRLVETYFKNLTEKSSQKKNFSPFIRDSGLIPRSSAPAQIAQRLQNLVLNQTVWTGGPQLPIERASARTNATLKIPWGLPRGGSYVEENNHH